MIDEILSQVDILAYVDVKLLLLLLAVGFIIKHFAKNVTNNIIPTVLIGVSFVYSLLVLDVFDKNSIINAIVNALLMAALSIGIHSTGKGFLKTLLKLKNATASEIIESITSEDDDTKSD